ncbi:hypothetical protein Acr_10g0006340 [Actinidia rufa]|uniref:Uncharacterized protein n=1 Tax=Actinidia rufa TaxID=165716 RepID=A0A7J0FAL3_9ERIC|nr:hypothetical protein Acr_10g0006340 [Actinidia rufa]
MDSSSNLTSLPEELEEQQQQPKQSNVSSAFSSIPDRPAIRAFEEGIVDGSCRICSFNALDLSALLEHLQPNALFEMIEIM